MSILDSSDNLLFMHVHRNIDSLYNKAKEEYCYERDEVSTHLSQDTQIAGLTRRSKAHRNMVG